jgi:di/tricarboxylate transporter
MLNSLRNVYLPTLLAILSVIFSIGAAGLWYFRKAKGRPIREILALLAAAFVLIAFMFPLVLCADEWLSSPDVAIHDLAKIVLTAVLLPIAFVVWRLFNRLAKPKQKANSHRKGRYYHEPIA